MVFNGVKGEFELQYTIGAFTKLKRMLATKNLRKSLLVALNSQDYETMCKAVTVFSDGKVQKSDDAFALIDTYAKENGKTYYDVFIDFMAEIEDAGFFKDKKTAEELKAAAESPETMIDTEELLNEAMKKFKGSAVDAMVDGMLQNTKTMTTGANTLTTSNPALTVVE